MKVWSCQIRECGSCQEKGWFRQKSLVLATEKVWFWQMRMQFWQSKWCGLGRMDGVVQANESGDLGKEEGVILAK